MLEADSAMAESSPLNSYVLDFRDIDRTRITEVGGKGANLGELSRVDGINVPAGYCVTTYAFQRIMEQVPSIDDHIDRLSRVDPDDRAAIRALSAEIRASIEDFGIPDDSSNNNVAAAIIGPLARLGEEGAYAVRSSATAEDLPTASFAGQQDTYLNVVGPAAILEHVSRCWASLFTERAVTYRTRNGFDHRKVRMAVVVQRMVDSDAAGILFTADPVTSNRKITTVEASFGLGEALVSGRVNADVYKVRDGEIVDRTIGTKQLAIHAAPDGGTREAAVELSSRERPALTDAQVVRLERVGRRIEEHFGGPRDIEWCLVDGDIQIVQSRPITTLFPIPETDDRDNHVYVSVGHQQMMTDPMKPLGLSVWQLSTPAPMAEAGGRLFIDVTRILASTASRDPLVETLGKSDPLIGDALRTVLDRGDFVPSYPADGPTWAPPGGGADSLETDPAIVAELISNSEASIAALEREIETKSGPELFDFIRADIPRMRNIPRSLQTVMAGMEAAWWLNEHVREWLDETNVADTLAQSVSHNITAEMGLALLDVADAIRPHPAVVEFLERVEDDDFLAELPTFDGGREAREAIEEFLDKYGMRCVGEIDITRPRWREHPTALIPLILGNIRNFEPGAGERRFEQGRQEALEKEQDLLARLLVLPDGQQKADETKRMIDRLRTFSGYREYPKYAIVRHYFVYKLALLKEAERLVQAGVIRAKEDIFSLRFDELHEVVCTNQVDDELIRQRKAAFQSYGPLTPPRVLTSDGEAVTGTYRRDDLPTDALVGLPVSAGTIEGRARVILDIADADVEPGDILVTAYTDPSWSPLFVAINGLVTEVGGQMTHGAVVAREYGLPAVVGVEHATRLIQDGQRIRVNGTDGYVEILAEDSRADPGASG